MMQAFNNLSTGLLTLLPLQCPVTTTQTAINYNFDSLSFSLPPILSSLPITGYLITKSIFGGQAMLTSSAIENSFLYGLP